MFNASSIRGAALLNGDKIIYAALKDGISKEAVFDSLRVALIPLSAHSVFTPLVFGEVGDSNCYSVTGRWLKLIKAVFQG